MSTLTLRDGLLTHALAIDPQPDGAVMLHTSIRTDGERDLCTAVRIESAFLDPLIADLTAIRDARPSEPRRVVKIVPAVPAQQRRIA